MQNHQLEIIIKKIKKELSALYQDLLESIILYGSQARGDAREDSDIDLLIILKSLGHPCDEMDKTTDCIAQLCLDYDVVISWQFISSEKFRTQDSPFLSNVRKEGILV